MYRLVTISARKAVTNEPETDFRRLYSLRTQRGRIFSNLPSRAVGAIVKLGRLARYGWKRRDHDNFIVSIMELLTVYRLVTISARKPVTNEPKPIFGDFIA